MNTETAGNALKHLDNLREKHKDNVHVQNALSNAEKLLNDTEKRVLSYYDISAIEKKG